MISDEDFSYIRSRLAQDPPASIPAKRITGLVTSPTLDYAEATSDVSITHTTEGAADTLVTGNAIILDGSTPILVQFFAAAWENNASTRTLTVILTDGTTVLGQVYKILVSASGVTAEGSISGSYRYTPTAGTYTFTAKAYANTGTNVTVKAGSGGTGAYVPMYVRVVRDG